MNTRVLIVILSIIFGLFLLNPDSLAFEKPPLFLKLGEQRIVHLPHLDRYSVSGTAIRYTRPMGQNDLLIKGISVGMSTLMVTHGSGPDSETDTQVIRVEMKVDSPYPMSLFQAMNLLETTEAIDGGTQFILRGRVGQLREARAIAHLKAHFANWIMDETSIEPLWLQQNITQISSVLKHYPHLKLIPTEGTLSIEGAAGAEPMMTAVTRKIQEIQPLTQFDIQTMKGFSPTLYFKVFLLEVKKEYTSKLGTDITQPLEGSFSFSPLRSVLNNSVNFSIQALSEKGLVRVLSAPELVVKSPGQAELFAGGELPIRLKSRLEDKVVWKNIGLSLKLDVKEYDGEKVRLTIETELNHINTALTLYDIPGIKTNRIKTQVEGTMGRPLLLSGLLQDETREKIHGLPGLSEVPILGSLFSSDDFQKDRSELVAILVPYREPPREPMQRMSSDIPRGYLPLSRNFISQDDLEKLRSSREYPWNVL